MAQRQTLAEKIILTGGLSHSAYFAERLSEKLGAAVTPTAFGRFAGALGAALSCERKNRLKTEG